MTKQNRPNKKKNRIQFTVLVDKALLTKANKVRKETWVSVIERVLRAMTEDAV